jgi:hypothetical protein
LIIYPAVSFVSFLQEKKSFSFLFFLERKENKRKSSAEQLFLCASAAFANVQHKTDGSYVNRPFFPFRAGRVGEHLFSAKSTIDGCP